MLVVVTDRNELDGQLVDRKGKEPIGAVLQRAIGTTGCSQPVCLRHKRLWWEESTGVTHLSDSKDEATSAGPLAEADAAAEAAAAQMDASWSEGEDDDSVGAAWAAGFFTEGQYLHFLTNPSEMEEGWLQNGQYLALGTAGGSIALIGGILAWPAISGFAGSTSTMTLPTSLGWTMAGDGVLAFGATSTVTVSVTGAQALAGAGILGGAAVFMSRKDDLKQIDEAARQMGIRNRHRFGKYVEEAKELSGRGGRNNFTFQEVLDLASEFFEFFGGG